VPDLTDFTSAVRNSLFNILQFKMMLNSFGSRFHPQENDGSLLILSHGMGTAAAFQPVGICPQFWDN
jgi:hypothetical protein